MSKKDKIRGGVSDGMTPEEIAKKHKASVKDINAQIKKGIKIEMEHVDDENLAREIALDHLFEIPDYYTRLEKMEKEAKKDMEPKKENITEFARRMRELAGISESSDKKSLKTIDKGEVRGLNENFMSDEMSEKMRVEAINYLNGTSGWVTVLYEPNDSSLVIFKDVSGLDEERDEIELDEVENYMEISVDEALDLVRSQKVNAYIKDKIPYLSEGDYEDYEDYELEDRKMQYGINPEIEDEFEMIDFEQDEIEEGENDSELYSLNENTIIVLDFLDEEDSE